MADGTLDLTGYDPLDLFWHSKIKLLLAAFERKERINKLTTMEARCRHDMLLTAILLPSSQKLEELAALIDRCTAALEQVTDWQEVQFTSEEQKAKQLADVLRAAWAREFGDPDSQETKKKIAATAEGLKQLRNTGKTE